MEVVKDPGNSQEERFTALVVQYQALLMKICFLYLGDAEQARDAVQETFLKAYAAQGRFRGECSEKNWLVAIARNTCRDMRRSAWFRHTDRRVTPDALLRLPAAEATEEERELAWAVMQLPNHLKDVVLLYYYQNFTLAEIAEALHMAPSSVSARLSRARKRLKAQLEKGDTP